MNTNYEDMETVPAGPEIRAILLNKAPKFGNDDERADKWVVELEDYIGSSYRYKYKKFQVWKRAGALLLLLQPEPCDR